MCYSLQKGAFYVISSGVFLPYLIMQADLSYSYKCDGVYVYMLLPTQEIKVHSMTSATSLLEPCLK